jgi:predicted permease
MLLAVVTTLFALAPAIRASAATPVQALRTRDGSRSHRRWTATLVAAQAAFCIFVLFVAGLLVTTFEHLSRRSLGFQAHGLVLMDATARGKSRPAEFWVATMDRLRSVPGVTSMAFAGWAPLSGNAWSINVRAPGRPAESRSPWALDVSPGFFATLGIDLLAGRDFRVGDRQPGAERDTIVPGVAIVNESFARTYFDGQNPVGRMVLTRAGPEREAPIEIVGWVRDASYRHVRDPMRPTVYFPLEPRTEGTLLVRTSEPATVVGAALRGEIARVDPDVRLLDNGTQTALVERQLIRERLLSMLSLFFAAVGLLLAAIGLYGVLHFAVTERRREIGVRMALGARPAEVIRSVASQQMVVAAAGAIGGLLIGLASSGVFETLLFEVTPFDPSALATPLLALTAAVLLAALPPAMRAVRIDPAETLRIE